MRVLPVALRHRIFQRAWVSAFGFASHKQHYANGFPTSLPYLEAVRYSLKLTLLSLYGCFPSLHCLTAQNLLSLPSRFSFILSASADPNFP